MGLVCGVGLVRPVPHVRQRDCEGAMTPEEQELLAAVRAGAMANDALRAELDLVKAKLTDAVSHLNAQAKVLGDLYAEREKLKAELVDWRARAIWAETAGEVLQAKVGDKQPRQDFLAWVAQSEFKNRYYTKVLDERDAALAEAKALRGALTDVKRTCGAVMRREAPMPSMALSGAIDVIDAALAAHPELKR